VCVCRFNKREEDFATRAGYDNYLEEREDIAFNLIEVIDVPAATERLARYERENADSIVAVAARQVSLDELMGMPLPGCLHGLSATKPAALLPCRLRKRGKWRQLRHCETAMGKPRPL